MLMIHLPPPFIQEFQNLNPVYVVFRQGSDIRHQGLKNGMCVEFKVNGENRV